MFLTMFPLREIDSAEQRLTVIDFRMLFMIDVRLFAGAACAACAAWLLVIDPGNAVGRDVTLISLLLQPQTYLVSSLVWSPLICPPVQHGLTSPDTPLSLPRLAFNSDMSSPSQSRKQHFVIRFEAHETNCHQRGNGLVGSPGPNSSWLTPTRAGLPRSFLGLTRAAA